MVRSYNVAGHTFSLKMDESSPLWPGLEGNYGPFATEAAGPEDVLFTLTVEQTDIWKDARDGSFKQIYVVENDPAAPRLDIYSDGEQWWVEMAPVCTMAPVAALRLDAGLRNGTVMYSDLRSGRFSVDNSAMLTYAFSTARLMTLEMHSSVVVKDGKAYMFLAKSGTGKSTQSRMWLENIEGTELLNDDNPVVRVMDDGSVKVFGTPWSGKTPCYRNKSAELGAFVRIRRCAENRITPLSVFDGYALISSSASGFRPDRSMADGLHDTISALALGQRCFVLDCRPDAEAARVCFEGVCRS